MNHLMHKSFNNATTWFIPLFSKINARFYDFFECVPDRPTNEPTDTAYYIYRDARTNCGKTSVVNACVWLGVRVGDAPAHPSTTTF